MLVNFIFLLLSAGMVSLFVPQNRFSFLWTAVSFAAVAYSFLCLGGIWGSPDFSVIWHALPNLSVDLVFTPSLTETGAAGVVILTGMSLYYNVFGSREQQKNVLNGLVLINCVFVLAAFSATNYIQLLAAVCMADVVVYTAIDRLEAKRQYIYGNFIADFLLLNILAVIIGQQGGIAISGIEEYSKRWHHRDFIAVMLLVCIFIKSGVAFFHTAYQKMSGLNFNRLNFILFATTPLMGFIVLLSLKEVLLISRYSYPLLKVLAVITIVWGGSGAAVVDNLKRKAVYAAMLFWGFVFAVFAWQPTISGSAFFVFLGAAFLFNASLQMICKAASDEVLVSRMGGFVKAVKLMLLCNVAAILTYAGAWWLFADTVLWLALAGEIVFMAVSAHILSEVYLTQSKADEWVAARLKNPSFMLFLPTACAVVWLFREHIDNWPYVAGFAMLWGAVFVSAPLHRLSFLYGSDLVQKNDSVTWLYNMFVLAPLQILGRILRLTVDFVFVERTVIASVKNAIRFLIFIFRRLHSDSCSGYAFFILIGVLIMAAAYYNGVVR
uniref:NADH:quinone oxidoreductase/Mrp antiporter membrane subunit domain-containing protein n=1 Tax=uncultured Alphaproteobacteria bacterium TaxID=91750 RepID=A0A6G8F353_9PROT|nr:hypothetical protein PlAlph_3930 [uncultured Alphaproteobacteria bacterium]